MLPNFIGLSKLAGNFFNILFLITVLISCLFLSCAKNPSNQPHDLSISLKDSRTIDAIDICKHVEFNEGTTHFFLIEDNINVKWTCDTTACHRIFTPTKRYDVYLSDISWEPGLSGKTDLAADALLFASALTKYDVNWDITKSYLFKKRFSERTTCLDQSAAQEFRYLAESVIIDDASGVLLAISGDDIPLAANGHAITDSTIAPNFEISWSDINCDDAPYATIEGGEHKTVAIKIRDIATGAQVQVAAGFRDRL